MRQVAQPLSCCLEWTIGIREERFFAFPSARMPMWSKPKYAVASTHGIVPSYWIWDLSGDARSAKVPDPPFLPIDLAPRQAPEARTKIGQGWLLAHWLAGGAG